MSTAEAFSIAGKIALITGSTKGIGKELARGFAAAGARVWVHGRDEEQGRTLAEELGGRFARADLARAEEVAALAQTLRREEERLDILVNNAGMEVIMPIEEIDLSVLDRIWRVNARAPVQLIHLLLPLLKAAPAASIVNITSIHETTPYPHNSAYCMTKAALAMLTKTISLELAPSGIRVNNLAPGAVETDINREVIEEIGRHNFNSWIPMGRVARAEEMIGPAIFLASDASRYVTGATLVADGGYQQNLVRYRP